MLKSFSSASFSSLGIKIPPLFKTLVHVRNGQTVNDKLLFGGGLVKIFTRYKHGKVLTGEVAYRFWSRPCDFDLRFLFSLQFLHKVHVSRLSHSICGPYPRNLWTSKGRDVHWCPRRGYKPLYYANKKQKLITNILLLILIGIMFFFLLAILL